MKRAQQKEQTREKIRLAALSLFEEKGVDATTIAEITARAGVAKGTFFFHFDSKEMVMFELQQLWVAEELERLIEQPHLPVLPTIQMMSEVIAIRIRYSHGLMRSIFQGMMMEGPIRQRHQKLIEDTTLQLARWLTLAQQRGEVTEQFLPEHMAAQIVETYFGAMLTWVMGQGDKELKDAIHDAFKILLRAFAK
jgi:AcrR family transcriptional regulator